MAASDLLQACAILGDGPDPTVARTLAKIDSLAAERAVILQATGSPAEAEKLHRAAAMDRPGFTTLGALAVFHALCGDADQAADWFEKAIEQRDPAVVGYLRTPLMRILRSSPRWPALAKQMNLPEVG